MPDTIRSKSALQALLADNTIGDISAQDVRDFLVSVDPEDAITTGTYGSLPSNQKAGFIYLPTDAPLLHRDTAAAWKVWGPIWPLTPVVTGSYSWVNQGTATESTANGFAALTVPSSASVNQRVRVKTAPATPYTVTALVAINAYPSGTWTGGLVFRESSTGKIVNFGFASSAGAKILTQKYNSPTSFSGTYSSLTADYCFANGSLNWLRVADNGTNLLFSVSGDGYNFVQVDSRTRTDFLLGGPDQVGYYFDGQNNVAGQGISVFSWVEA